MFALCIGQLEWSELLKVINKEANTKRERDRVFIDSKLRWTTRLVAPAHTIPLVYFSFYLLLESYRIQFILNVYSDATMRANPQAKYDKRYWI